MKKFALIFGLLSFMIFSNSFASNDSSINPTVAQKTSANETSILSPRQSGSVASSAVDIRANEQYRNAANKAAVQKTKFQVALVLGGGGARGYAELGVIHVLSQAGVPINIIAGTSAGSIVGALYADSGSSKKLNQIMLHATLHDLIKISFLHALQGPIVGNRLQKFLRQHMQAKDFNQLKIKFIAVATDLKTGQVVLLDHGPVAVAVNASAALPPLLHTVTINGQTLIDGGMSDPVPVNAVLPFHPEVIIAVNIAKDLPKKMPDDILQVNKRADLISLSNLANFSEAQANIKIHPIVGDVGTFDIDAKQKMYQAGVVAAEKALPAIKKLLAEDHIQLQPEKS